MKTKPKKKRSGAPRRKKQAHKTARRPKRGVQTMLAADGKPIDDGRPRIDAIESLDKKWQQLGYELSQLGEERKKVNAKIVVEVERAGLERYRTDEGRLITIDVKKTAKAKRPPKAKPRKRREAEQAVAAQA